MSTISVLEGADDLLGRSIWQKTKGAVKKTSRIVKKSPIGVAVKTIQKPITTATKLVAPVIRPVDKMLKSTPLVRTAYRSSISTGYLYTGQFGKAKKSYMQTFSTARKDLKPAVKVGIQNFVPGGSALTSLAENFKMPSLSTTMPKLAKISANSEQELQDNMTSAIAQNAIDPQGAVDSQSSKFNPMLLAIPVVLFLTMKKK